MIEVEGKECYSHGIFDQSDDQSQDTFIYLFIFEPHKTRLGSYILKSINLVHLFG